MSFWTYILKCADGSYYTGHTDNMEQRFAQHESGFFRGCYTYDKRPLELVWADDFQTRDDALSAERRIKGWSRGKKEALVRGDFAAIQRLAKKDFSKRGAGPLRYGTSLALSTYSGRTDEGETTVPTPFVLSRVPSASEVPVSKDQSASPPVIVLVRPQLGENIGKAARAMLNFGLTELRLVAPRDGWPNASAGPAAAGADIVLASAEVFETLAEAIADIPNVYATTVRKRGLVKPVLTPAEAASEMHAQPGRNAILFGSERSGLDADEVAAARTIITVPINPEFGSLNLAQAVILCAYEWSKFQSLESPPKVDLDPPAPQKELDGLVEQVFDMLEPNGYFFPPDRAQVTARTLRNVLTGARWNSHEVRTMRGVFNTLKGRYRGQIKPD